MTEPPFLKSGSTIGIVATARKISWEELEPAIGLLSDQGFTIRTGQRMFGEHHQFSGTDEERAADMQRMLDDPEINAILGARGGYGTVRIIDRLDFTEFRKHPKWICGYSDVTALHNHITTNFGICTIHSTMPVNMQKLNGKEETFTSLIDALQGQPHNYDFPSYELNRNGNAEGEVVGGNLSMLYSLLGSPSDVETDGKLLFLEDLDEYLYHIDRMMMNLKRNGKLEKLAGLVVGGMSDMNDNAIPFGKTAVETIRKAVEEYDYPVCFNFPAGHIDNNCAFVVGKKAALQVEESGSSFKYV